MSKAATYRAEWTLEELFSNPSRKATIAGATLTLPDERKFGSLEAAQSYVDRVLDVVRDTYPSGPCTVQEGTKALRKRAYHSGGVIVIPQRDVTTWAWREIVVLHEIAHHLTKGHGHDAVFRGALLYLLTEIIGPEAGFAYTVLLSQEGLTIQTKEKSYA